MSNEVVIEIKESVVDVAVPDDVFIGVNVLNAVVVAQATSPVIAVEAVDSAGVAINVNDVSVSVDVAEVTIEAVSVATSIIVEESGPRGPAGKQGKPGPPGEQYLEVSEDLGNIAEVGTDEFLYVPGDHPHTTVLVVDFPIPSAEWTVDVGSHADVVVIDSAGTVVWPGEHIYGPGTAVTLRFSGAFSGKAYCYL